MKTQTVSRKALGEIYPQVCSGWQTKITRILNQDQFAEEFEVSESLIKEAYSAADKPVQTKWLEKYTPKPKENWRDVTSYEKACEMIGQKPRTLKEFEEFFGKESATREFAGHKIKTGIKAVNEGYFPNFDDDNQRKYYIWKYNKNNDFGFVVYFRFDDSGIGADFYIETEEKAKFIHGIFEDDIKQYYF